MEVQKKISSIDRTVFKDIKALFATSDDIQLPEVAEGVIANPFVTSANGNDVVVKIEN